MSYLNAQTMASPGSSLASFLPFLLIGLIFYFLIVRPQTKQKKQHDTMLTDLKSGDKVLTRGGIYGKIINFQGKDNKKITIDIGSGVKVNIARSYIAGLADSNESE
ncbi:uncharacterized protein METZ01_LOCUS507662 [marine metagenome]|uniref:Preprotein translocase subunit YajC n=1 Tax=marine metagenome TaxID=408172 RepID=A0A383EFE0_9ZZZZ